MNYVWNRYGYRNVVQQPTNRHQKDSFKPVNDANMPFQLREMKIHMGLHKYGK